MGTSRRVGVTLGNGISQTVIDSGDATGLNRFGRVKDLHFKDGSNTVHQYQYGYDISGNRTCARVIQATIGATAHDNDRSYLYGYDDLQRLILGHMGRLETDINGDLILDQYGNPSVLEVDDPEVALRRKLEWFPDSLGNWSGWDEDPNLELAGQTRTDKTPGEDETTGNHRGGRAAAFPPHLLIPRFRAASRPMVINVRGRTANSITWRYAGRRSWFRPSRIR